MSILKLAFKHSNRCKIETLVCEEDHSQQAKILPSAVGTFKKEKALYCEISRKFCGNSTPRCQTGRRLLTAVPPRSVIGRGCAI